MEKRNTKDEWVYFWVPTAIGMAGALLLLLIGGFRIVTIAASLVLLVVSPLSGLHLLRLRGRALPGGSNSSVPDAAELQKVCMVSLPLWSRQIGSSRHAGDEAVASLTRLFGSTVKKMEATLSASRRAVAEISGGGGGILTALNSSETDLQGVMETLKSIQERKGAIVDEVGRYAEDLKEMAKEVQHIALQVRILSFNAGIEAAHAGSAGHGFGIVAAEMRKLAAQSAETGEKMRKKIESVAIIDATLANIFQSDENEIDADSVSIGKADTAIHDVLRRFKDLTANLSQSVEVMETEAEQVRQQISDALVEFQFQDRVSQIMAHVIEDMNSLCNSVKNQAGNTIDAEAWLSDMVQKFSTQEEFDNLSGKRASITKNRDTTFF